MYGELFFIHHKDINGNSKYFVFDKKLSGNDDLISQFLTKNHLFGRKVTLVKINGTGEGLIKSTFDFLNEVRDPGHQDEKDLIKQVTSGILNTP